MKVYFVSKIDSLQMLPVAEKPGDYLLVGANEVESPFSKTLLKFIFGR
jgi:hypothetical protein